MFPKSTVTVSLLAGSLALAGMAAATWMTTSRCRGPAMTHKSRSNRRRIGGRRRRTTSSKSGWPSTTSRTPTTNSPPWRIPMGPTACRPSVGGSLCSPISARKRSRIGSSTRTSRGTAHTTSCWLPGCRPSSRRRSGLCPLVRLGIPRVRGQGDSFSMARKEELLRGHLRRYIEYLGGRHRRPGHPLDEAGRTPLRQGRPLPALDHRDPDGYQFGLVSGSVRSLPFQEAKLLPAIITRAGGEVIQWPAVRPAGKRRPSRRRRRCARPLPSYLPYRRVAR